MMLLQKNGISSYRYDKRGIGSSTKVSESTMILGDFVYDASKVVDHFAPEFDQIYILGHSEGSLIGSIVAQDNNNVTGLISVSGISNTIGQILLDQLAKFPDAIPLAKMHLNEIRTGQELSEVNPFLRSIFRQSIVNYLKSVIDVDGSVELQKVELPILILGGQCDLQVPTSHAEILHKNAPSSKLEIITNMGHIMKNLNADCSIASQAYTDPNLPIHGELVASILQFIPSK